MTIDQTSHLLRIYLRLFHYLDLFFEMIKFQSKSSKKNERFQLSHENRAYTSKLTKLNNNLLNSCSKCCFAFESFRALTDYLIKDFHDGDIDNYSIEYFNC